MEPMVGLPQTADGPQNLPLHLPLIVVLSTLL